jgi:hypothetical protein
MIRILNGFGSEESVPVLNWGSGKIVDVVSHWVHQVRISGDRFSF